MVTLNLPNVLSLSRIPCSIILLIVYQPESIFRTVIVTILALFILVTDVSDGWLARKQNIANASGYIIDGIGDRAFHLTIYLILFMNQTIGPVLLWLLTFREIIVYAARLLNSHWLEEQPKWVRQFTKSFAFIIRTLFFIEMVVTMSVVDRWINQFGYDFWAQLILYVSVLIALIPPLNMCAKQLMVTGGD